MPNGLQRVWLHGLRRVQFPYLLFTRSFSGLLLALNWWDIIDEHVLLGGTLMFDDVERLQSQGVRAVVNLCAERPDNLHRLDAARMEYLWLPVRDTRPPTVEQIMQGLAWIESRVNDGAAVYIHCAAGIGRSATLLACWYMYTRGMSVAQVLHFIKQRRPQAALTRWQVRRLEEFATLLQHTAGKIPTRPQYMMTSAEQTPEA
jgi:atypical dual specificity phosphatase